ncbi:MAG: branched-chain amino acid ABC transporter permease [Chloroflexi bacterium]|nr:branched-chain amino acid ABC transporter permease [Chloroflexota bacterium]
MDWNNLFEQLINGLTVGSFYALIALGYTMVYGVLKMINFAHGEILMMGAYSGLFTLNRLTDAGLYAKSPLIAVILTVLAGMAGSAITGITVERFAYRPLRRAGRLAPLISAIGASIFLQEFVRLLPNIAKGIAGIAINGKAIIPLEVQANLAGIFDQLGGAKVKAYPNVLGTASLQLGDISISHSRLIVMAVSLVSMLVLYLLVQRTRLGKAMRAVSENKDTAALMGIDVNQVISRTFLIGSALAGIAGVMMGLFYLQIKPTMGFTPGIKAFTAAVMGGIGNVPGAMLGGYVLGLAEALGMQILPTVYKDVVAFSLLILTLIFKPTGIFGRAVSEERM